MGMPRRFLALALVVSVLLAIAPAPGPARAAAAPVESFRFAHITDSHVGTGGSSNGTASVMAALAALQPAPALVINGGDVTETGARSEYDAFDRASAALGNIPVYAIPGNHDGRWYDVGKADFRRRYGPTYRSFDHGGVHFVLLDVTVDAEAFGHFSPAMLNWLRDDLTKVGTDTPVLVFTHHPVAYPPQRFIDNDDDLLAVLAPYNVAALFSGHGHLNLRWQLNGIPQFMTAAALDGGYKVIDVSPTGLTISNGGPGGLTPLATIPLPLMTAKGSLAITQATQSGGQLQVTAQAADLPAGAAVWAAVDRGAWRPLSASGDTWQGSLPLASLPPGTHRLHVYATAEPVLPGRQMTDKQWVAADLGAGWFAFQEFQTSGSDLLWQVKLDGPVQGEVAADSAFAYAGAGDGAVYALQAQTGSQAWRTDLGAPVTAGVTLWNGKVLAATIAGDVAALNPSDGSVLWRWRAPGPVLSQPVGSGDAVYVGDAAGGVAALDAATGTLRWRTPVGAAVRAAVRVADGSVFAGAWDGKAYALDVDTGRVLWSQRLQNSVYFSPANAPPLYYRGRVYFTTSLVAGKSLFAVDARNGHIDWTAATPVGYSAPALVGGMVAVTTVGGWVHRFDPLTGKEGQAFGADADVYDASAVPVGGAVVTGSMSGQYIALDPTSGKTLWRFAAGDGWQFSRVVQAGGNVYAGNLSGLVTAIGAAVPAATPLTWGAPGAPADAGASGAGTFPNLDGHWAQPYLRLLAAMGVSGRDGLNVRAGAPATRAEWATLVARYLGLQGPGAGFKSKLTDIQGNWAASSILALEEQGIMVGEVQPDGRSRFRPDSNVSRAEAVAVLGRILQRKAPLGSFHTSFTDLGDHWATAAVAAMEQAGLVKGETMADGSRRFWPQRPVTEGESAALLVRLALGRDIN